MRRAQTPPVVLDREEYLRGNTVFSDLRSTDKPTGVHSHDYFEIEMVNSGHGIHTINGHTQPLGKGDIYLLTPQDVHNVFPQETMAVFNVSFSEEFISDKISFDVLSTCQSRQISLDDESRDRVYMLMRLLNDACEDQSKAMSRTYIQSLLNAVLVQMVRTQEKETSHTEEGHLRSTLVYLQRHFREPLTLSAMAKNAHLSTDYFSRQFKRITGRSFIEYLSDLRLRYAARLLRSTDMPITDVCYQSGFNCYPTFSRAFLKQYSITPSKYRQERSHPSG